MQAFIDKEKAGVCRIVAVFRQNLNYAKDSIIFVDEAAIYAALFFCLSRKGLHRQDKWLASAKREIDYYGK